jgi:hypothetical protein
VVSADAISGRLAWPRMMISVRRGTSAAVAG